MRSLPFLVLIGCFGDAEPTRSEPPRHVSGQAPAPAAEASVIDIPITMSLDEMTAGINADLPTVLVEEQEETQGMVLDLKVSRRGDFTLAGTSAGHIGITAPLQIHATLTPAGGARAAQSAPQTETPAPSAPAAKASKRGRPPLPPRPGTPSADAAPKPPPKPTAPPRPAAPKATVTAQLDLAIDLAISISEAWTMEPAAEATYTWAERPKLSLGPVTLDVTKIVDEKLAEQLPDIARKVEAQIRETDDLSDNIGKAWSELTTPKALPGPASAWLAIEPTSLFLADPRAQGRSLKLNAGMVGTVRTLLSDTPPKGAGRPLPPRARPPAGAGGLRMVLDIALGWDALSKQASEQAAGQSWPLEVAGAEAGTFALEGAEIYPSGTSVAVGLHYKATSAVWETDGTVWVQGQPTLDADAQAIRITDFDYALDSWELSAAGANTDAVRDLIRGELSELLVFSFREPIEDKRVEVNAQLAGVDVEGGSLSGELDEIAVKDLFLSEDALHMRVGLSGALAMQMDAAK